MAVAFEGGVAALRRRGGDEAPRRITALAAAGGGAVQDFEALLDLLGADADRVDLLRDAAELVAFVGDDVGEGRVVGRPAQQQVVVRDDEVGLRERAPMAAEGAAPLVATLLARALIRPRRDAPAQQLPQPRPQPVERRGHRADLPRRPDPRARLEQREVPLPIAPQHRIAAVREHRREPSLADVVRAALDRERPQTGMAEETRGGGDVLVEQLVLQELGPRREDDGLPLPGDGPLHRERDHRREIREGFPDARFRPRASRRPRPAARARTGARARSAPCGRGSRGNGARRARRRRGPP